VSTRGRSGRIRRILILLRRFSVAAAVAVLLAFLCSAAFIGLRCYSGGGQHQAPAADVARAVAGLHGYAREEASTFLTLPEWYIVYSTEEYARFTASHAPSGFPYVGSIRQFWRYYGAVCGATKGVYPFSAGNHLMLGVIGSSFSIEYGLRGLYESTVGRVTASLSGSDTPEDAFAHATAVEYGAFMHTAPWYEFPFRDKLAALWASTPMWGPHIVRKWERKLVLTAEYGAKAIYGRLIRGGSKATYAGEDLRIHAWIDHAADDVFADGEVKQVKAIGPQSFIVTMPRYEAFTVRALDLIARGVRFVDIAGNDEMLVTAIVPTAAVPADTGGTVILREPLLTNAGTARIALKVPVRSLHTAVTRLQAAGATIEHLYDY
jgi:hypothetical protein